MTAIAISIPFHVTTIYDPANYNYYNQPTYLTNMNAASLLIDHHYIFFLLEHFRLGED